MHRIPTVPCAKPWAPPGALLTSSRETRQYRRRSPSTGVTPMVAQPGVASPPFAAAADAIRRGALSPPSASRAAVRLASSTTAGRGFTGSPRSQPVSQLVWMCAPEELSCFSSTESSNEWRGMGSPSAGRRDSRRARTPTPLRSSFSPHSALLISSSSRPAVVAPQRGSLRQLVTVKATEGSQAVVGELDGDRAASSKEGVTQGEIMLLAAAIAAGLVAGALLPLPAWAKPLPELLVGILFRGLVWRALAPLRANVSAACQRALKKFNNDRLSVIIIPFVAAFVGWITNWLAVQMIFYPIGYWGIPIKRWILGAFYDCPIFQPLGIIGWQGIVPAKAAQMAYSMVEMVTTQLIDIEQVFARLDPSRIAQLLRPEMPVLGLEAGREFLPGFYTQLAESRFGAIPRFMRSFAQHMQDEYVSGLVTALKHNIHACVDLKELVVTEMCNDKNIIVRLFQNCGKAELRFLVESGIYFGFLLGIIQMGIWLFYDNPWTLTIGGAIVGYITNWLALKCIFEPLHPVRWGPFVFHGIFLKRQFEVSVEFANFLASEVLTSVNMWRNMLFGRRAADFQQLVRDHTISFAEKAQPGVMGDGAAPFIMEAADRALQKLPDHLHPIHGYIDETLQLQSEMEEKLKLMSPEQFERVLHPIFEEDELTLIIAGGVLGAIAGYVQQRFAERQLAENLPPQLAPTEGKGMSKASDTSIIDTASSSSVTKSRDAAQPSVESASQAVGTPSALQPVALVTPTGNPESGKVKGQPSGAAVALGHSGVYAAGYATWNWRGASVPPSPPRSEGNTTNQDGITSFTRPGPVAGTEGLLEEPKSLQLMVQVQEEPGGSTAIEAMPTVGEENVATADKTEHVAKDAEKPSDEAAPSIEDDWITQRDRQIMAFIVFVVTPIFLASKGIM